MKMKKMFFLLLILVFSLLWSIEMVKVRGTTFTRGDKSLKGDLYPEHKVKLSSFYISKYEVTQKEWNRLMDSADCPVKGDNYPVSSVSWWDAVEFCNKLSLKEGLTPCYNLLRGKMIKCDYDASGYRLPSEAEWELAAIGGKDEYRKKYSGSDILQEVGWAKDDTVHAVGQKMPNQLGLYDMTGNVSEWCNDWYDASYFKLSQLQHENPKGANYGNYKVFKGGHYGSGYKDSEVFYRNFARQKMKKQTVGFRVAKSF